MHNYYARESNHVKVCLTNLPKMLKMNVFLVKFILNMSDDVLRKTGTCLLQAM